MRVRRLLMFQYYFPPTGGIASLRADRFAAHLPSFGWAPTVLSPDISGMRPSQPAAVDVRRTRTLELSRLGRRLAGFGGGTQQAADVSGWRRALRDAARRWLYFPDAQVGWYPFAVREAMRAVRRERFDAVFSSSVPLTSHLIARTVATRAGLPWVAEFRDFWTSTLAQDDPHLARHRCLEQRWLDEAAAVVTVSPSLAREYERKGAREVALITNGYEPEEIPCLPRPAGLVVAYLGTFYPDRQDLSPVWAALRRLRLEGAVSDLRIRFIGDKPVAIWPDLEAAGLSDAVEVTGLRSHAEALRLVCDSSVLLLAGPRDGRPELRGMLAAKTFEYLASGLPVLQVADPASDSAHFLAAQAGCITVGPDDVDGAYRALAALQDGRRYDRDLRPYTRRALTERLAALLDKVTGSPAA